MKFLQTYYKLSGTYVFMETKMKEMKGRWNGIKQRCYNPNIPGYHRYGGRGITVCDEWLESFENFLRDMGFPPSDKHTLDRRDNDLGYSKDNCRWATVQEQNKNKTQHFKKKGDEIRQVVSFRMEPSTKAKIIEEYGSIQKWFDIVVIGSIENSQ